LQQIGADQASHIEYASEVGQPTRPALVRKARPPLIEIELNFVLGVNASEMENFGLDNGRSASKLPTIRLMIMNQQEITQLAATWRAGVPDPRTAVTNDAMEPCHYANLFQSRTPDRVNLWQCRLNEVLDAGDLIRRPLM